MGIDITTTTGEPDEASEGRSMGGSAADTVYVLGLIGALVWFWRRAEGPGGHALAVLKAIVWPAVLVYRAFAALER